MDSPYLFISYSRIQFYFVEALAHQLRTMQVPYWFDVERLEMGKDWQAGIDGGLANCQALVLVASASSINSPNVKYEWDTALKANKPVYLALFEAVELPPELSNAPIIDFRGNFNTGVAGLAELFQQGQAAAAISVAPRPNRYGLPVRLPRDVFVVALTLLLTAIANLIAAFVFAPISLSLVPVCLVTAVAYASFWWRFVRRRYIHSEIASLFPPDILMSAILFLAFIVLPASVPGLYHLSEWQIILVTVLFGLITLGSIYSIVAMINSPAIFRWTPLGQVPPPLRDRTLHITRKRYANFAELGKTYSLSYAPGDKRVGAQIRQAMAKAFYAEVPIEQADHNLIVLSNTTPVSLFEAIQLDKPVSVVASSIRGATESEKQLWAVTRFQWLDYRDRGRSKLKDMTEILWLGDSGKPIAEANYHVVPESFAEPVVPTSIYLLVNLWRVLAAGVGSFYLAQLIGIVLPPGNFMHELAPRSADIAALMAIEIVLALVVLWLSVLITQRSINFTIGLLGVAASLVVGLVIPLTISQNVLTTLLTGVNGTVLIVALVIVGVIFVATYGWGVIGLYRWLPLSNERLVTRNDSTLRQPFGVKLWRNNFLFVFLLGFSLLALTQVAYDVLLRREQIDHLQITVPRVVTSAPVQDNDIRTVSGSLSPKIEDQLQQFASEMAGFGPLLWVGGFGVDPNAPIVMLVWRYQPAPGSSLSPPDQAESMVDAFVKSASSVPGISNVVQTKITNGDTLVDGVSYDIASGGKTSTIWTLVARAKQASYFIVVAGDQQPMTQANVALIRMVNSIAVN